MCIYCGTNKYRKIYEHHNGAIPVDESGRTYDIHHIDGDRSNNEPNNLLAVSIADHLAIHKSQGDYGACVRIMSRLALSPNEIANMARMNNLARVANGTHNLLGGEISRKSQRKRVEDGVHHFLSGEVQRNAAAKQVDQGSHRFQDKEWAKQRTAKLIEQGRHNFQGGEIASKTQQRRVAEGVHQFIGGDIARQTQQRRVAEGTHHLLGDSNPNGRRLAEGSHNFLVERTCPHCNKVGKGPGMLRYHFDKCKSKL